MRLSELSALVPHARLGPADDPDVVAVTHDSRRARPGTLFAAFPGLVHDARAYVADAAARGASAALGAAPAPPGLSIPYLAVENPRRAGGLLAAAVAGRPADRLVMVGVTGTSGKTTTTLLVDRLLAEAHPVRGLFGTLVYRAGSEGELEAARTTPEATELQPMLGALVTRGGTAATMECSSHALVLERLAGSTFDVAVFSNLSRDHLDFHRDLDDYFEAKARLFSLLKPRGVAVVNADDPYGRRLLARLPAARALGFSLEGREEALVHGAASCGASETTLRIEDRRSGAGVSLASRLVGRPNAENLLAAASVGFALGLPPDPIARALASVDVVPGRLEAVPNDRGLRVFVDYAHKPGALEGVLKTARGLVAPGGKLVALFGCGGDRDRGKRPEMGRLAAELADVVVVTSDNPRSEAPAAILEEIRAGVDAAPSPRAARVVYEVDRRAAIAEALRLAAPGDVVVLAGKGHETYQIVGDAKLPFDDRVVAREELARLSGNDGASAPGGRG